LLLRLTAQSRRGRLRPHPDMSCWAEASVRLTSCQQAAPNPLFGKHGALLALPSRKSTRGGPVKKSLLSLALLCCTSAQADVVYNFEWDSSVPNPARSELIVTDEAWRSGRVQWTARDHSDYSNAPVREARVFLMGPYLEGAGWTADGRPGEDAAEFDLRFVGDSIEGSIFLYFATAGTSTGHGTASEWTFEITSEGQEFQEPSCLDQPCVGTGRWVLDQSTVPVPLPGTAALLAAGAVFLRRNRRQA
jgi:hypothetical protein